MVLSGSLADGHDTARQILRGHDGDELNAGAELLKERLRDRRDLRDIVEVADDEGRPATLVRAGAATFLFDCGRAALMRAAASDTTSTRPTTRIGSSIAMSVRFSSINGIPRASVMSPFHTCMFPELPTSRWLISIQCTP